MKKRFIVKVQLPLISSHSDAGILVYNEDRSIMQEFHIKSKAEAKELYKVIEDEMKGYFYAYLNDSELIIDSIAPWQKW